MTSTYDAIIVGARCAGAATAMLLARAGMRTLVLERAGPGTDTISTHALMRTGALLLERWGLLDAVAAAGTTPVRKTTFFYDGRVVEIPIKPSPELDALVAPRRPLLDGLLQQAAETAGAEIRYGHTVAEIVRAADGRVAGVTVARPGGRIETHPAGIVIGADGRQSAVARAVGAAALWEGRHRSATLFAYWAGLAGRGYEWHYRPGLAAGLIPTDGGLTCVFVSVPPERLAQARAAGNEAAYRLLIEACAPELAAALAAATQVGRVRGFLGQAGHLRQGHGPGWALVGDAGYFKDPITAHGITDAFRDAELLASAVVAGVPIGWSAYEVQRRRLSRPLFEVTERIASFDWTMAELEALHLQLNAAMRAEYIFMEAMTAHGMPVVSRRRAAA
jgi:2-polyprenyl-6-methoxyphenol hydroxylase-like FAD-dependent oxidoreductase